MCTSLMPIDDRDSHTSTRHMHLSWHWSLYGEREAGRGSLVWKMCVRDFTAMYRVISNNPGGGESGYSSCTDLTEPRHGPSEHVGSTDRPTPSLTVTPITLCFPISCRFLDSRDVLSWQLIFFRKSKTIFSWN